MSEQHLFNPEDLDYLSKLLSRAYLQVIQSSASEEGEVLVEAVQTPPIIDVEIVRQMDLDVIASSCLGTTNPLGQLSDFIVSTFNTVASWIVAGVETFIDQYVKPILEDISNFLSNTVVPAIRGVIDSVSASVKGFIDTYILPAISGAQSIIVSAISGVSVFISTHVVPTLQSIIAGIGNVASIVVSSVSGIIQTYVIPAITNIGKIIWDAINSAVGGISNFISTYVIPTFSWIRDAIVNFISTYIVTPLINFKDFVVGGLTRLTALVSYGFDIISRTFMGFVNAVLQLPTLLWQTIPKWITEGWVAISSFAMSIAEFFKEPVKWLKWLAESVWGLLKWLGDIVLEGLKFLSEKLWEGAVGFWNMVKGGLEAVSKSVVDFTMKLVGGLTNAIIEGAKTIGKRMLDAVHGFMNWAINSAKEISEDLGKLIAETMTMTVAPIIGGIAGSFGEPLIKTFETASKGSVGGIELTEKRLREISKEISETHKLIVTYLREYSLTILYSQAISYGVWMALHGIATPLDKIEIKTPFKIKVKVSGHGRPAGVGGEVGTEKESWVEYPIEIKPGLMLRHLASEIRASADTFIRSMMYGIGIWFTRPIMRLAYAMLRNTLPVELPTINELIEITRRNMPTTTFDEMLDECRNILRLYGFSDQTIEWITKTVEESIEEKRMIITVKDRFDVDRTIPLSLIYQLPSASDVARMCIRDIFGMGATAIDSFIQVYSARGMHRDIGILYYLLHYKYPPPERLWTFVVRGWSGMLWATIPKELMDSIQKEAEKLGAPIPTHARDWNFKAKGLWSALQMYMTWHDYARFTWIPKKYIGEANFTSDNQIMLDTLADIPTKIDMRWMTRWGLYDFLASKGVSLKSEVRDFAVKILEDSPVSKISMDLSNFARTLQATGLHPDWVPITAVAETMNALADERTLLRTGFLGLFKEGFYDVKSLETMLSGFIKVSFKIAYFDSIKMEWVTDKYVNIPVMHLPPERRLIELRALMDRALDILREIQRDISNAYVDNIVLNYEEYKSKLSNVIGKVNEVYASDWENITGEKLPDELKLKFVEDYYKPYIEGLAIFREVYTVRRIRSWTMRWLGWIMYRVATGLVTSEELNKLVDTLVKYSKLTDTERQFFKDVFDAMAGITIREYAPTPQQIASLSEYIVIPEDLIKKVFEVKMIGKEWQPIWQQYISIRPIADDIKALIGTYRRVSLYVKVPEDIEKQVKEYAKLINYTDKEWSILGLRNQLEEMLIEYRESKREYIPTPSTIASMLEYVNIPSEQIDKVFEARKVPEEWRKLWRQYYEIRPIADDVRILVSAYYRAKRYQIPLNEVEKKVIDILNSSGMTTQELSIRDLATQIEIMVEDYIENRREYIPTPSMLATLSEYMVIDKSMIEKVYETRRVPKEWQDIWNRYIAIRPIADDIKALINTYRRVSTYLKVPEEIEKKVMNYAKMIGYTDTELEVLALRINLEEILYEYRENKREYIPTPSMLATMSEYVSIPDELIMNVFKARKVPEEWQSIWRQYIIARAVADDVRRLLESYRRASVYAKIPEDVMKKIMDYAKMINFTETEMDILNLRVTLEELILEARASKSEYIPSPSMLATISEVIPSARKFFDAVVEARKIPKEWQPLWYQYITVKPLIDEVRKYVSRAEQLYARFMTDEDAFKTVLSTVAEIIGYEAKEVEFILQTARMERTRYAWSELIGDVDRMTMLAEYSPEARSFALATLNKMIDALPVTSEVKNVLKKMWEQFIRIRPVMDEVRTYIRDLINAVVDGSVSWDAFEKDLEEMREWGLDDYEIMFYKNIAILRKARKLKITIA